MMSQSLEDQWSPYTRLIPFETLVQQIEFPKACLSEPIHFLLPSLSLAQDGPVVHSVFLVTENYLCEVRLNQNSTDFDVAHVATIGNYRITIGKQEITQEELATQDGTPEQKRTTTLVYSIAEVKLVHTIKLTTELTYVGENCDSWINQVFSAIPIHLLTRANSR